jgi:hypothetical protein
MQLPSIDRSPNQRPAGADVVSAGANKVIPVPPVNPAVAVNPQPENASSVVNHVNPANQANKPSSGEAVYTSVSDPARRGSEAATAEKDWTIHRPEPEKVENPPPEPISKMLLEFLRNMWRASGSAVEATLAENRNQNLNQNLNASPGVLAKENLTYSPSKVTKTAKSLSGDSPSSSTSP